MNDDPGSPSGSPAPRLDGAASKTSSPGKVRGFWDRLTGARNGDSSVRETLEELIETHAGPEVPIEEDEKQLLANILDLRHSTVEDIMVPRADIVAVEAGTGMEELIALFTREGHSRVPVYRETLDDAIGMVHIKDLLVAREQGGPFALDRLVRKVLFVSPSMLPLELLLEMRVSRTHMALVVDEYGGVDGLLTIEDLVEEIVGDIEDEHDDDVEPDLTVRDDGIIDADARVEIETFEERVGMVLSDEERDDIDTLGGLVSRLAGRVPIRGELVAHPSGLEFEVLDADPRRIKRLRVHGAKVVEPAAGAAGETPPVTK
jgi:CBS domain containing-hemolysin-like protein